MPWTTEDLKRLVELEAHLQGVDPRLARAVVSQESEWNPNATGDNGRSIGLFQLQEAAAKDAGLHPRFRSDVPENIKAGVTYLKQKLTQSKGNVEQALSRYNRGTPDYRGIGDPNYVQNVLRYYPDYQAQTPQKPGMLARVGQALSPASAEASTAPAITDMTRLQELEAHLARLEGQAAPQAATSPAPPTATSTPEQDAAYRASRGQQAQPLPRTRLEELEAELARRDAQQSTGGTSTAPAPAPVPAQPPAEESITPERRFLDLPSSQQMPLEDRTQRFQEFYRLKPALKEEFLRSEEPPARQPPPMERFLALPSISQLTPAERAQVQQEFQGLPPDQQEEVISREVPRDLHQAMEQPAPPGPHGAAPDPPRAAPRPAPAPGQPGWAAEMIDPLKPVGAQAAQAEVNRPAPLPVPPEAAIAALPGMAGYAIGAKIAPALGAVGKAVPPILEAIGGYAGHRANVKLGYEKEGALGDILSALPLATRALGAGTAGWLERTIKEAPVAARDQTMDLLGKLFSRGGAQGGLTYLLSGDPQLAAWVGGSYATARSLLGFALRSDAGKQLVEATLKAGRAIGGEELGMLMNIGRTGHTATPHGAHARAGSVRPVDIAPMMDHPAWKGKLKTEKQREEALRLWQDKDTSPEDRAEMLKVMDGWLAAP